MTDEAQEAQTGAKAQPGRANQGPCEQPTSIEVREAIARIVGEAMWFGHSSETFGTNADLRKFRGDDFTDRILALSKPAPSVEGEVDYTATSFRDLRTAIGRIPDDFPNYGDYDVALPAGHWRAIDSALSNPADTGGGESANPLVTFSISVDRDGNSLARTQTHGNSFAEVYRGFHAIKAEVERQIAEGKFCPANPKNLAALSSDTPCDGERHLAKNALPRGETHPAEVQEPSWEPDAELRDWSFEEWPSGRRVAGAIYGDKKGRFKDGERVVTSPVVRVEGPLLTTRHSIYRLTPAALSAASSEPPPGAEPGSAEPLTASLSSPHPTSTNPESEEA